MRVCICAAAATQKTLLCSRSLSLSKTQVVGKSKEVVWGSRLDACGMLCACVISHASSFLVVFCGGGRGCVRRTGAVFYLGVDVCGGWRPLLQRAPAKQKRLLESCLCVQVSC